MDIFADYTEMDIFADYTEIDFIIAITPKEREITTDFDSESRCQNF